MISFFSCAVVAAWQDGQLGAHPVTSSATVDTLPANAFMLRAQRTHHTQKWKRAPWRVPGHRLITSAQTVRQRGQLPDRFAEFVYARARNGHR